MPRKEWTQEDVEKLKSCYASMTNNELISEFPDRTLLSIYKKARSLGFTKKHEIEYANRSNARKREKGSNWKGGVSKTSKGYILVLMPEHHRADKRGYVLEHILVFEKETGIKIPPDCCIHHINGDKTDNRIQNLCLMTHTAHTILHSTGRKYSEESKRKMSDKTKERLKNKENHPLYKKIDIKAMIDKIESGCTVTDVCKEYGICKSTFYAKKRGMYNAE